MIRLASGREMPLVGLGTARLTETEVLRGILAGARHLDCARIYGNEEAVGRAMKESGVERSEFFVTTKIWNDEHRAARESLQQSLADLQLDYVDLLLVHWPMSWRQGTFFVPDSNNDVIATETWLSLEKLVKEGKVRSLGVSNFDKAQLEKLLSAASIPLSVNQIEAHPFFQNSKTIDFCKDHNIQCVAWGPLNKAKNMQRNATLYTVAKMNNRTEAEVALRWNLDRGLAVIPKSTNPENVKSNLNVINMPPLSAHDHRLIKQCDTQKRRFPDIIGIWPSTAHPLARAFGLCLALFARCLFFITGPIDFVNLSKKHARRREEKQQLNKKKKE